MTESEGGALLCGGCRADYPVYDGIPWLYRDVASSRAQWAAKLAHFQTTVAGDVEQLQKTLKRPDLMPATRKRLKSLLEGHKSRMSEVQALLTPFELSAADSDKTLPRERIPSKQHIASYVDTIFRDWGWGNEEALGAVSLVESQLGRSSAGQHVLVLGGGAGRLSFELERRHEWRSVVQLDINPLLTRVAALLSRGQKVVLTEIPNLPCGLDHVAVKHELRGPHPSAAAPHFVLGDVFTAPFEEESFDVLITPWFVDILPEDFKALSCRLNRLLRNAGIWINFGPLSFESVPLAAKYTQQEIEEALAQAGMALVASEQQCVPYLHSPHGMQKRNEDILVFKAVKKTSADEQPDFSFYPAWMRDTRRSIPKLPAWQEMHAQKIFDIQILSLIDGQASIQDIVETLSSKFSLPPDRCQNAVNRFFSAFFEKESGPR